MKGGKDEAVVARLPEELDVGGVGDSGHWDAVGVFGGGAEGLGHLLLTHAPVGGQEGNAAQEQGGQRLEEGDARGAHLLQERHGVRDERGLRGGRNHQLVQDITGLEMSDKALTMEGLWRRQAVMMMMPKTTTSFFLTRPLPLPSSGGNSHLLLLALQQAARVRGPVTHRHRDTHTPSSFLIHPYKSKTDKSGPSAFSLIPRLVSISPLPCFHVQMFTAAGVWLTG